MAVASLTTTAGLRRVRHNPVVACPDWHSRSNRGPSSDQGHRTVLTQSSGLLQIFADSRAEMLRFLTARVGDRSEAEDVLQDLWIRLQSADAGPVASGRAYLYRAAQNLVVDRARSRQRRLALETEWSGTVSSNTGSDARADIEADLQAREDAEVLAAAMAKLPERAGLVLRLHKIARLPHAVIATRLGISRSGVEKHIATAMMHLRRALDEGTS